MKAPTGNPGMIARSESGLDRIGGPLGKLGPYYPMLRRPAAIVSPDTPRRTLMAALMGICILSLPVFCTRFLNDMDYYALISDKLLRGAVLYRDAIDTKPPFVFLHYAAIFGLFGLDNFVAVKIVTMICLAISALLMRALYKELFPESTWPDLAALTFVLASFSGWGEDFLSSNTELLSNLFVLAAVLCMAAGGFSSRASALVPAGMFAGIAFLYRYQAGAPLAAYVLTLLAAPRRFDRPISRLLMIGGGFLVPLAALVAYYSRIGALRDLLFLLQYQRFYVSKHELYLPQVLGQVAIVLGSQGPLLVLAGSQALRMVRRPLGTRDLFLLIFLLLSLLSFFVGGHYFAHYIVQAIPPVVVLATARILSTDESSTSHPEPWFFRHARAVILANVVLFWIVNTAYYVSRPADPVGPNLTRFVRAQTTPADSVFMWSGRYNVLFEIDRVYATRFLSNEFFTGRLYGSRHRQASATAESARSGSVPELWPALLKDLETERPRIIVDDAPDRSNFTIDHYAALLAFVRANYEPGQMMDGFCVYLRKG
jgi:hypothetical protein